MAANGHENKRPHNIINSLYLQPNELEQTVIDRYKRYEIVKKECPEAETYATEDADLVIAAFGATARNRQKCGACGAGERAQGRAG